MERFFENEFRRFYDMTQLMDRFFDDYHYLLEGIPTNNKSLSNPSSNQLTNTLTLTNRQDGGPVWKPHIDMVERGKDIMVRAELPGVPRDNVRVEVKNNMLIISGEKKSERKEENERYYVTESRYGKFIRQIRLPEHIDPNEIKAQYQNGILEISIPKLPDRKQITHQIPIS